MLGEAADAAKLTKDEAQAAAKRLKEQTQLQLDKFRQEEKAKVAAAKKTQEDKEKKLRDEMKAGLCANGFLWKMKKPLAHKPRC